MLDDVLLMVIGCSCAGYGVVVYSNPVHKIARFGTVNYHGYH